MYIKALFFIVCMTLTAIGCEADINTKANFSANHAKDFIRRFPDSESIHWAGQSNHFSWQAGYIMYAMDKMSNKIEDFMKINPATLF